MISLLRRLTVFAICACGLTVLGLIVTAFLFPGRGFLKGARTHVRLHLLQMPDQDWQLQSCEPIAESDFSHPSSGVSVFVVESSMGRTHPGICRAWRIRNWWIEDARTGEEQYLDFSPEGRSTNAQRPSAELRAAVVRSVEQRVIPTSRLWELWPTPPVRTVPLLAGSPMLQWQHWTESSGVPNLVCVALPAALVGVFAAYRVAPTSRRPRGSAPEAA
jgi:hypothetical protein